MNVGIIKFILIVLLICLVSYLIGKNLADKIAKVFYELYIEQRKAGVKKMEEITISVSVVNIDKAKELVEAAELKLSELKAIIEELEQIEIEITEKQLQGDENKDTDD